VILPPRLRKLALTAHVISSVGWLGAVVVFLALSVVGLTSEDARVVRGVYLVMEPAARSVLVPFAFASLFTGIVVSLGTTWGLFRHYWVLIKLLLTILTLVVLMLQLEGIGTVADAAATSLSGADLRGARISLVVHAAGGLLVLLAAAVLSVYKPRGLTRYGWRKQHAARASSPVYGKACPRA
jgi:hypothetical protein